MRKVILSVLFATLILFDKSEVHAQESLTKDKLVNHQQKKFYPS
jgi:hypothetical protein